MKKTFQLLLSTLLLVSLSTPLLADTIRLKDGSVIRGQVIGFKDQQFTILIGGNAKGRRGQTTIYVEDVESIEFDSTGAYVQTVAPNGAGTTSGMLGYMFWAAECPSSRRICTTPPNSCEGGVGVGATTYGIPIPMPPLRQN